MMESKLAERHGSHAPCPKSPTGEHCWHSKHEYSIIKRCCWCGKTEWNARCVKRRWRWSVISKSDRPNGFPPSGYAGNAGWWL